MKKLLLFLLIIPFGLFAQPSSEPENEAIQQEATLIARSLVEALQLNELEYIKVRELTVRHIMGLNDIADYYQYDPELLEAKTKAAEMAYERRLKYILNAQQLENYLTLHHSE